MSQIFLPLVLKCIRFSLGWSIFSQRIIIYELQDGRSIHGFCEINIDLEFINQHYLFLNINARSSLYNMQTDYVISWLKSRKIVNCCFSHCLYVVSGHLLNIFSLFLLDSCFEDFQKFSNWEFRKNIFEISRNLKSNESHQQRPYLLIIYYLLGNKSFL